MKKPVILTLVLLLLLFSAAGAQAAGGESLQIIVNVDELQCDVQPIIVNGRTLVPVRAIAEKLGFTVDWAAESQTVTIKKDAKEIKLTVNDLAARVDGIPVPLEAAPILVSDRTLVPLRFVAETMGLNVLYDKWNNVTPMIWVTEFNLLNDQDAKADDNYTLIFDDGPPVYELKAGGETARHIRLGESVEDVRATYGRAYQEELDAKGTGFLRYFGKFLPQTDAGNQMIFTFDQGKLVNVTIG